MANENIYVRPGDLGTNSGTEANPYLLVSSAIDIAASTIASGDTSFIELMESVSGSAYDDASQGAGWYIYFDVGEDDRRIVLRSSEADVQRVITMTTTVITRAIRIDCAASDITLKDLDFGVTAKDHLLTTQDDAAGTNITLDNITCTGTSDIADTAMIELADTGGTTTLGTIRIQNCNLSSALTDAKMVEIRHNLAGLIIDNSEIHATADGGSVGLVYTASPAIGYLNIKGSNISSGYRPLGVIDALIPRIMLEDSTFKTIRTSGSPGKVISVGLEYNTVADWVDGGSYTSGDVKEWEGWVYECVRTHNPAVAAVDEPGSGTDWESYWILYEINKTTAVNCDFEHVGNVGIDHAVGAFFGSNVHFSGCSALGGDTQFTCKGNFVVAENCYAKGPTAFSLYSQQGGSVSNCYFETTTDNTCATLAKQNVAGSIHYPDRRFHHNICVANSATEAPFLCSDTAGQHYSDYNIYWNKGGTFLTKLGGANQTSLAAIQAFYEANSNYKLNDQNSKNQDPGSATGILIDGEWYGIPSTTAGGKGRYSGGGRYS